MEEKKFYITTSIFYANAQPHLGHAYEFILADVIARYHRGLGEKTFFLTGTDEHGDKIIRTAQKEGVSTQAFVNSNVEKMKGLASELGLSNDFFIRTSDQKTHWPGAQKMWRALEAAGDIYKATYKGLYCVGCEAFITEKELIEGKCQHHGTVPESIEEDNYFFRLSKYVPELKKILESGEFKITPQSKVNEMLALLSTDGDNVLSDVSISRPKREIPWGIPVPGDEEQLMYVWCDALSNYISAIGYGQTNEDLFKTFWPANLQVIGKDIVRFHALLWPAMLLSAKVAIPHELLVHGFVTSGGKKMSKSIGNVLGPEEFILEYGVPALRYYCTREVSPTEDWDLTREKFKEVYNANLANGLGNLISRTLKMAEQYFGGKISGDAASVPPLVKAGGDNSEMAGLNIPYFVINDLLPRYHTHMRAHELNKGADVVWELIGKLDQFIAEYEPFKLVKTDKEATEKVLWGLLYGLYELSGMLAPIMPDTAQTIKELVGGEIGTNAGSMTFSSKVPTTPLFMRKE
jgi:methionyl-tRNA synthetase